VVTIQSASKPNVLLLGGHLSASQAGAIADFLTEDVLSLPELQTFQKKLGSYKAFIVRLAADQ